MTDKKCNAILKGLFIAAKAKSYLFVPVKTKNKKP